MAATVRYAPEGETPDVVNDAGEVQIYPQPPDNIVLVLPLPNGKSIRCTVVAQEFDSALQEAHEKLVEASADEAKKAEKSAPPPEQPEAGAPSER
jgi:hypothetical protein